MHNPPWQRLRLHAHVVEGKKSGRVIILAMAAAYALIASTARSDVYKPNGVAPRLDCTSKTPSLSLAIGNYDFWIPAEFTPSKTDKNGYDWMLQAGEVEDVFISHSIMRIHRGSGTEGKFKGWNRHPVANDMYPDVTFLSKKENESYGLVIFRSVIVVQDDFIEILGPYEVSWDDILGCMSK